MSDKAKVEYLNVELKENDNIQDISTLKGAVGGITISGFVINMGEKSGLVVRCSECNQRVAGFQGSFTNLLRAWAYIKYKGSDGLLLNTQRAVLNANYMAKRLEPILNYHHEGLKKHEVIMSTKKEIPGYLIYHFNFKSFAAFTSSALPIERLTGIL